jgi:hypothetical protein
VEDRYKHNARNKKKIVVSDGCFFVWIDEVLVVVVVVVVVVVAILVSSFSIWNLYCWKKE